jgi:hypothetical protein
VSHSDWTLILKAILKKRSRGIFCKSEDGKVAMSEHTLSVQLYKSYQARLCYSNPANEELDRQFLWGQKRQMDKMMVDNLASCNCLFSLAIMAST